MLPLVEALLNVVIYMHIASFTNKGKLKAKFNFHSPKHNFREAINTMCQRNDGVEEMGLFQLRFIAPIIFYSTTQSYLVMVSIFLFVFRFIIIQG